MYQITVAWTYVLVFMQHVVRVPTLQTFQGMLELLSCNTATVILCKKEVLISWLPGGNLVINKKLWKKNLLAILNKDK